MIEIPDNVKPRTTPDRVTFTAVAGNEQQKYVGTPCYSEYMQRLPQTEFFLMPDNGSAPLNGDIYLEFVEIMKSWDIIPKDIDATIGENGQLLMHIPAKERSRHRVYAALCTYRWSESLATLPYMIVTLHRTRPELTLWQIIHYAMSQCITTMGHSWSFACRSAPASCAQNNGGAYNLATGLALPLMWKKTEKEMHTHDKEQTYSTMHSISTELGPMNYANGCYWPSLIVEAGVEPNDPNDILSAHWMPLYDFVHANARKKSIKNLKAGVDVLYNEVIEACPSLKKFREDILNKKSASLKRRYDWD